MLEETTEHMVLYQQNFRVLSGLFITSNQFRARAGFGRGSGLPGRPIHNPDITYYICVE